MELNSLMMEGILTVAAEAEGNGTIVVPFVAEASATADPAARSSQGGAGTPLMVAEASFTSDGDDFSVPRALPSPALATVKAISGLSASVAESAGPQPSSSISPSPRGPNHSPLLSTGGHASLDRNFASSPQQAAAAAAAASSVQHLLADMMLAAEDSELVEPPAEHDDAPPFEIAKWVGSSAQREGGGVEGDPTA